MRLQPAPHVQTRRLSYVGYGMQILAFSGYLERLVHKPSKLVELVAREIAQVKALDLLDEVDVIPAEGNEREDDVKEADGCPPRLDKLEEGQEPALLVDLLLGEHQKPRRVLRHKRRVRSIPLAEPLRAEVGVRRLGAFEDNILAL